MPTRLGLACLLAAGAAWSGCADTAATAPAPAAPVAIQPFAWETSERPYEVLGVTIANVPRLGDQARTSQAVIPSPQERDQVETALREMYDELKGSIETAQRDAEFRRISITIYDSREDVECDPKGYLCRLYVDPDQGDPLPEFAAVDVEWQWRDPAGAPPQAEREIEWQYLRALKEVDASVDFGITDAEVLGMNAAERRAYWERRYDGESEAIKSQLAAEHGMTVEALEQVLTRVLEWKHSAAADQPQ